MTECLLAAVSRRVEISCVFTSSRKQEQQQNFTKCGSSKDLSPLSPISDASKVLRILTNAAFHRSHFNLNITFPYRARHLFVVSKIPQFVKRFYKL
jgi:hypothetical protein